VVSVTDPYGRILGFLDRSRYTFLSSSSSVVLTRLSGPCSRPTTFFYSGSAGNRTRASGSVAKKNIYTHKSLSSASINKINSRGHYFHRYGTT
jgi:hypothetical protein